MRRRMTKEMQKDHNTTQCVCPAPIYQGAFYMSLSRGPSAHNLGTLNLCLNTFLPHKQTCPRPLMPHAGLRRVPVEERRSPAECFLVPQIRLFWILLGFTPPLHLAGGAESQSSSERLTSSSPLSLSSGCFVL